MTPGPISSPDLFKDIFDVLKTDHETVKKLLEQLQDTSGRATGRMSSSTTLRGAGSRDEAAGTVAWSAVKGKYGKGDDGK